MKRFKLTRGYIELDNLIKVCQLAPTGPQAKQIIQKGMVKVNGSPETRIRRKLKKGDSVEFGSFSLIIDG